MLFHPLHALFPEIMQCRCIGLVVPVTTAITAPFVVCPSHRFLVGGADNDTHLVGKLPVGGVVIIKGIASHGRPDEVTLQAKNQLEHSLVKQEVKSPEGLVSPSAQCRCFIVEEDAPIFHSRFPICKETLSDADGRSLFDRHIGPPVPW